VRFTLDEHLLAQCRAELSRRGGLRWLVGGSGSGKTTAARAIAASTGVPVYDMDEHIYGTYHRRFDPVRHPANSAWAAAPNGLRWLLEMSWQQFDEFNHVALVEYLDLLAADLAPTDPASRVLVDGGVCNPAILSRVIPAEQIVCIQGLQLDRAHVWTQDAGRLAMKDAVDALESPQASWATFLDFDARITHAVIRESRDSGIAVHARTESDSADATAAAIVGLLGW
jgi:hypothetical protein